MKLIDHAKMFNKGEYLEFVMMAFSCRAYGLWNTKFGNILLSANRFFEGLYE